MGIFGCALATLISYFAYFIIGFYIERHTIIEFTDVKLLVYSIVFVFISVLITFLFDENSIVFYQIALKTLFILIYVFSIFIFGFIPKKIIIDLFNECRSIAKLYKFNFDEFNWHSICKHSLNKSYYKS